MTNLLYPSSGLIRLRLKCLTPSLRVHVMIQLHLICKLIKRLALLHKKHERQDVPYHDDYDELQYSCLSCSPRHHERHHTHHTNCKYCREQGHSTPKPTSSIHEVGFGRIPRLCERERYVAGSLAAIPSTKWSW